LNSTQAEPMSESCEDDSGSMILNFGEAVSITKCYLGGINIFFIDITQLDSDSLIVVEISTHNGSSFFKFFIAK
jgi:hypothetical protein